MIIIEVVIFISCLFIFYLIFSNEPFSISLGMNKNQFSDIKYLILTVLIIAFYTKVISQERTMLSMPNIQQSTLINPAIQHDCRLYIGLPIISSVEFKISHSGFAYKDIFKLLDNGEYMVDLENLEKKIHNWNYLKSSLRVNLLAAGYRYKGLYFNLDIANRTDIKFGYPDDYIMIRHGNGNFLGNNYMQFAPYLSVVNFNEISFGISRKLDYQLTIGGKLKYLSGVANSQLTNSYLKLYTEEDMYGLRAEGDIGVNVSFPLTISYDSLHIPNSAEINNINIIQDFIFNKNRGAAIDLGAVYDYNEKISLSASLIDLGYIRWRSNISNYDGKGDLEFTGFDISEWLTSEMLEPSYDFDSISSVIVRKYTDSLQNSYQLSDNSSPYYSFLHPKLFIGGSYTVTDYLNFGVVSRTSLYNKRVYSSATLSVNGNFWKDRFQASLSWSFMDNTARNIGVGMGVKLGPAQIYVVSDNLLLLTNYKKNRGINMHFGINLIFGCKEKEKKEKIKGRTPRGYNMNLKFRKNRKKGHCPAYR